MKPKLFESVRKLLPATRPGLRISTPNPFEDDILRPVPTSGQTMRRFEQAIKKTPYPFPPGRQPHRSTYKVLAERKLWESIVDPALFAALCVWQGSYIRDQRELRLRQRTEQVYSVKFHERMIELMVRHTRDIKALLSEAKVDERWAHESLSGALEQLRKDLQVIYPFYPWTDDFPPMSFGDLVRHVHAEFADVLDKRGARGPRMLAAHLTAVFCTPPSLLRVGKLKPTPEAVRKLVSRRSKLGKTDIR